MRNRDVAVGIDGESVGPRTAGHLNEVADLGDTAWRTRLARHDDLTRQHVEEHDGRVVKSTGDGALATFDEALRSCARLLGVPCVPVSEAD